MNVLVLVTFVAALCCYVSASNLTEILQEKAIVHKHELSEEKHFDKEGHHNLEYDHAIFLGVDKAKFDKLSPEQAKKGLRTLVQKVDSDGDGFVTVDEMTDWVRKVFHAVAQREAKRMMRSKDKDEDGKVTWKEYESDTFSEYELKDEDLHMQQLIRFDKRRFDLADKDNDGFLSTVEEGKLFLHPELSGQWEDFEAINIIDGSDADGDMKMDMIEFIGPVFADPGDDKEPAWVKEEEDKFKDIYDMNKDGKLDKDEVKEHLLPGDELPLGQKDARHLVKSADEDKDGKLSVEEMVMHHEFFVGSHITDYGRAFPHASTHDEL